MIWNAVEQNLSEGGKMTKKYFSRKELLRYKGNS